MERYEDKKDGTNSSEKKVLETEDLFGDKDSDDDDDPSAETFLESRSINVNTEVADNKTLHESTSLVNIEHSDIHKNVVDNETGYATGTSLSTEADSAVNPVLSEIKEEPGLGTENGIRSSNKREREE